uniref:site-specific integrase n=1 Tax=Rheinheimera sp. TaxID=1869214 RepID=UPI00404763E1
MSHQITEVMIYGARNKIILKDGIPLYYPNLYATFELSRRALNTRLKYLQHLGLFEDFLVFESIDLIKRLEQRPSCYLSDAEISRFVNDASLDKETLDKKYRSVRMLPTAFETVGSVHAHQRVEAVRDYLAYLYDILGDRSTRIVAVDELLRRINRKIKAAKPAWKKNRIDEMKGLSEQDRQRLLAVMHPDSAENPFASKTLKLRNYIILLLGLEMGLRRSEMLLLKISDIHWHNRQLSIVNLEDTKLDSRTNAPQFKTHERQLVLSEELIWALKSYVEKHRCKKGSTEAKKHPFLLVSHRRNEGKSLSIKAMDCILNTIGVTAPELKHIHLHILRHDAVYSLLESMREDLELLAPEDRTTKVQKILTYAFGWSAYSSMPGLYGAKFWKEEADKAMVKRSDNFKLIREVVEAKIRESVSE